MPIEYCYKSMYDDHEDEHALLEPTEGMFITTYIDGEPKILAVYCDHDDAGGSVSVLPIEGALADETVNFVDKEDLPSAEATVVITPDSPHEHAIATEDGYVGLIVARYASSLAITKSGLIPENLRWPDKKVIVYE